MTPSLRLSLLLSVAVHAALAATVRMEMPARPEQAVIEAWLRPQAALAPAAAAAVRQAAAQPAARSAKPPAAAHVARDLPARPERPAAAASSVPAAAAATPSPPAAIAAPAATAAVQPAAASPAAVPAPGPGPSSVPPAAVAVQPALEPPRFKAAHLYNPPPPYPNSALRRGIEGTVLVEVLVSRRGEAIDVRLVASAGDETLDKAALEAVHGWRFVPARRGNEAVEATVRIPMEYRLN